MGKVKTGADNPIPVRHYRAGGSARPDHPCPGIATIAGSNHRWVYFCYYQVHREKWIHPHWPALSGPSRFRRSGTWYWDRFSLQARYRGNEQYHGKRDTRGKIRHLSPREPLWTPAGSPCRTWTMAGFKRAYNLRDNLRNLSEWSPDHSPGNPWDRNNVSAFLKGW